MWQYISIRVLFLRVFLAAVARFYVDVNHILNVYCQSCVQCKSEADRFDLFSPQQKNVRAFVKVYCQCYELLIQLLL